MRRFFLALVPALILGVGAASAATVQSDQAQSSKAQSSQAQSGRARSSDHPLNHRPNYYNWLQGGGE
jgi:hypothetical protein